MGFGEVLVRFLGLGRLFGLEEARHIESYELSLGAAWAQEAPGWLFFGCVGLAALAALFYTRYQRQKHPGARAFLGILRATVLCLLLILLAEPVLTARVTGQKRPTLWLLFDGTGSMSMADQLPEAERQQIEQALGLEGQQSGDSTGQQAPPTRNDYLKALVTKPQDNLIEQLWKRFRLRAFIMDRRDGVRSVEMLGEDRLSLDLERMAKQLTTEGTETAIGAALQDLARRESTSNLAGLVIFSDFCQNSGPPAEPAARSLGVPIYTVGFGARTAMNVAVESIEAPPMIKKDEEGTVRVTVRQQGFDNHKVQVALLATRLGGQEGETPQTVTIDEKSLELTGPFQTVEFQYKPDRAGRFNLTADVEHLAGEVIEEDNRRQREITILDDYMRLLFVEYEPTWEWRFIKEVFHRDKLVGLQGFRTFLRSSDPRVRQTNEMFLPTMTPPRSEFFKYDVIFLGDMPATALSPRFCEMVKEFVREFNGGLVILSGPRFGAGQLVDTPLGEMLPVIIDPAARIHDKEPFRLRLTPMSENFSFMRLAGETLEDNQRAWDNLGPLPWYQPVVRRHPLAQVLAEHPTHTTVGGKEHQPLIAVRQFGKGGRGMVVYLGFNETWRLRRKYGERYYRQFWGQLIHTLALNHALGDQKRFVVSTDREEHYKPEEEVVVRVDAYDSEFRPLGEKDLPDKKLRGELVLPAKAAIGGQTVQPLSLTMVKDGLFETRFPVTAPGEYRLRVFDPTSKSWAEKTFAVKSVALEREAATRNVALQEALAGMFPGGRSYELSNVDRLAEEIRLTPKLETNIEVIPLWNTWLCFGLVVVLLLGEWTVRKWVNLP